MIITATAGLRGFDVNAALDADAAAAFAQAGYRFAVRYLPRQMARNSDLSAEEIQTLHAAGLAVMAVQHVESESSWTPSQAKGRIYGATAAQCVESLGLQGSTVWCDLEGVAAGVSPDDYCRAWCDEVHAAGAMAGLYVGWHAGLTPDELYALPFTRYWSSYNLNGDEYPAQVGVCMKQHAAHAGDVPDGVGLSIDTDMITGDQLGRCPSLLAPDDWATS